MVFLLDYIWKIKYYFSLREMNNSQFVQEHPQQHYGAPPTPQQQNGQHNPTSDSECRLIKTEYLYWYFIFAMHL